MDRPFVFHSAGEIIFGRGSIGEMGKLAKRLGAARALVVTDPAIVQAGLLARVIEPAQEAGVAVEVFDGGEPEPSLEAVNACVVMAREFEAEALISVGGGSNTDLAKAAATVLRYGGHPRDYLGEDKIPGPILPLIAVSTTAGTGSAVSAASVLSDKEQGVRAAILSNYLRPAVALYDPLLTVTCPPRVTADAGMDALTHAVEAFMAIDHRYMKLAPGQTSPYSGKGPLTDTLALEAIRLVGENLRLAVHQGTNLEARENMHLAAMMSGLAFSNAAVALVHALEYPIGVMTHCTHGAGNGLLLPFVMRYNLPVRMEELALIGAALGEDVDGLPLREAAELAVDAVEQLKEDVGLPLRLRDLGLDQARLPEIAKQVVGMERLMRNNPRWPTEAEVLTLLQTAF